MSETEIETVAGQVGQSGQSNIPLVFMKESALFGDRKPLKSEWLRHVELYTAISTRIDSNHITGLQRVRGLWRIYLDNLHDKVTLMEEGVPLRGKTVPVLNTNPQRPDGENTVRIRIQNIPLSADDGIISRVLTLRGIEIISMNREKLRVNGKLTNCETGDRLVVVKTTTLQEPLPNFMTFGMFTARVFHAGQSISSRPEIKCSKCLQSGHKFNQCGNDWVCRKCHQPGHKQTECTSEDTEEIGYTEGADEIDSEAEAEHSEHSEQSENEEEQSANETVAEPPAAAKTAQSVKTKKGAKQNSKSRPKTQQSIDRFVNMSSSTSNVTDTPAKLKRGNAPERSPPTPVDVLHDQTSKRSKSQKQ